MAAEGIEITDQEADAEIARMAEEYKVDEERVRAGVDVADLKKDLAAKKALELVKAAVKKPAEKKPAAKKASAKKAAEQSAEKKAK